MKKIVLVVMILFSGSVFSGDAWHKFMTEDNPHAKGGCAAKKDKMAEFHKFHHKKWQQADNEKKVDSKEKQKPDNLEDYI